MKLSSVCRNALQFTVKNPIVKRPFPPLPTVSDLVKLYKVRATKLLSQNFLYDPNIINKFIACFSKRLEGYHVCEVGPGPGSITRGLLEKGADHLTVIEKDSRFLPILQYVADVVEGRLSIVHGDVLNYDMSNCFPTELSREWHDDSPPFCVFGNLPFNISLPLLFRWLDLISRKDGMFKLGRIPFVLTFQCEVAERLMAGPKHPQRSRLSVTSQYLCDIKHHFTINGGSFFPKPKVEVGVVKIVPKKDFDVNLPFHSVDRVVKHLLSGKRRPCMFGVSTLFPPKRKDLTEEMFQVSGVYPKAHPHSLENQHFYDLCLAYEEIANRIPQIRKVDTFGAKEWKKHFDEFGNPLELSNEDTEADHARESLRNFLHNVDNEDIKSESRLSRRQRKLSNRLTKNSKGLFDS